MFEFMIEPIGIAALIYASYVHQQVKAARRENQVLRQALFILDETVGKVQQRSKR